MSCQSLLDVISLTLFPLIRSRIWPTRAGSHESRGMATLHNQISAAHQPSVPMRASCDAAGATEECSSQQNDSKIDHCCLAMLREPSQLAALDHPTHAEFTMDQGSSHAFATLSIVRCAPTILPSGTRRAGPTCTWAPHTLSPAPGRMHASLPP